MIIHYVIYSISSKEIFIHLNRMFFNIFLNIRGDALMKKPFFYLTLFILILSGCINSLYTPTIVNQSKYGSFDISFDWELRDSKILLLTGVNDFWVPIFDVNISITTVDQNLNKIGITQEKYIGSLDLHQKFENTFEVDTKGIPFIQVDYSYQYGSVMRSYSQNQNYQTIYLKIK